MQATKETFEDSVIGEDHTQDNPEEAEEREESGTAPPGMERTTQTRQQPLEDSRASATPNKWRQTKLPSHLKDFIIDKP